jgi:hypothetical protein
MTGPLKLEQAIRMFLAQVPPGERIETLALATTLLAEIDDGRSIEDVRAMIRIEAIGAGVDWWDEK